MKMKDTSPEVDYWDKVVEAMISHQAAAKEHSKYAKQKPRNADWTDNEMVKFVDELISMHRGTYINLFTWPSALAIVRRYYDIEDEMLDELERKG